ncbi:MAG: peptidase M64 [Planctomycetes bacterium]|nr:peptidase M64 [Planctomycetota bacterium]
MKERHATSSACIIGWFVAIASFGSVDRLEAQEAFDAEFTGRTLRIDTVHFGTAKEERVAMDGLLIEGPWPGRRTALAPDDVRGEFRCSLHHPEEDRLLWREGYSTIFQEWQTTAPARAGTWKAFHESVRVPEPRIPVRFALEAREGTSWRELFTCAIDTQDTSVVRAARGTDARVAMLQHQGEMARKVDLAFLAEGYTRDEHDKFLGDARRLMEALFRFEPYRSRRADFNVWAVHRPSQDSGVTVPSEGVWMRTPLGARFDTMGSTRYVLSEENEAIRDVAAQAPYDTLVLLLNARRYGGGGIYGTFATCAVDNTFADYLFVHEFGHSFAGLADEYYTSQVAYEDLGALVVEPWEPNVALHPERGAIKWGDLLTGEVPLPTPWNQERFDALSHAYQLERARLRSEHAPEERLESLGRSTGETIQELFRMEPHRGVVGAFEGAMYRGKGLWRPELDCVMFTREAQRFCRVCERAIDQEIDRVIGAIR